VFFLFIACVPIAVAALIVFAKAEKLSDSTKGRHDEPEISKQSFRIAAGVVFVVAAFVALAACLTTVDARAVGVKTAFGREAGTVGPGLQVKAPWVKVEEWTTRNQVVRFVKGGKDEDDSDNFHQYGCITVRLGNQSDACIEATVTFAITEKSVVGLWKQHKTFKAALRDFIEPQAKTAVDFVFGGWNPVAGIDKGIENVEKRTNEDWSKLLQPKVRQIYAARSVDLVDAQVTFVHLDDRTREQINQISAQQAATQVAKEKIKTAEAEAAASAARREKSGPSCVDLYRDLAAMDQLKNVNVGFNCGQPTNLVAQPK
jgi:regulator of protease activity HflC (stomatin/prohibitin superfamily)